MKLQNSNINKRINNIDKRINDVDERCNVIQEHVVESVNEPVSYTHLDVYKRQGVPLR